MKHFLDRHEWTIPIAVVAVLGALVVAFVIASPNQAARPAPATTTVEVEPVVEPEPAEEAGFDCDDYLPTLMRLNADLAELDYESSSAASELARINREVADLMDEASVAGCM